MGSKTPRKQAQRRVAERKRAKARRKTELGAAQRQAERDERMILRPGPALLDLMPLAVAEADKPDREGNDGLDREAMLRQLRSMSEAEPNIASERKIHACRYSRGVLVLCRDEGCEAMADLRDGGPDTLTVDGVDVTALVEGDPKLLQQRLTPIQIYTLAAVVDAIAELES